MPFTSKQTATGILICLAVVFAWFSPWWAGGRNLAPLDLLNGMMAPWRGASEQPVVKNHIVADAVDQYLVYRMVAADSYRKEGWLGWSSLTYGGTPQYANTMALYYDWTMQLHRWFDFWTAWHLGLMGQVMLAAVGMFLFLRGRVIGLMWSCCGALVYAANSQFVTWIYHRWALGAFCWVPWILWSIDAYRRGSRGFWVLVPLFTSMAFLGGTLQHGVFVILAVVMMAVEEMLKGGRTRPLQPARLFGRYLAWGGLGTALAAMMLLPCIDAFLISNRLGLHSGTYGNADKGIYPQGWLQPLFNLAAYPFQIFPSVVGRCDSMDLMKGFKSELFYIAYFGSLPVLIAFLAFFRKQSPLLARLLIGAGLLLPLTPLVRVLYQRLLLLFILGGILAFAHFMETASRETRLRVFKFTGIVTAAAVGVWTILSFVFRAKAAAITALLESRFLDASSGSSFGYFREWMHGRFSKVAEDLCIWSPQQLIPLILFLAALAGLGLTASLSDNRRRSGMWMVALAVVLEVSLFGSRWVIFTDPAKFPAYPVTPEVTALRESVGDGRTITLNKENTGHMAITPFVPNTLSAYGIASIMGYDSIIPNGMAVKLQTPSSATETGRLGVSHLMTYSGNAPGGGGWKRIWESPSMVLFENQHTIPRYAGFRDARHLDLFLKSSGAGELVALRELNHLENSRVIEVPADVREIRVAENHAEGWQYRIDSPSESKWLPARRANDASMVLSLDQNAAGAPVKVLMRYDPPMRKLGFLISAAALAATLAGGAWVARNGRTALPTAS